MNTEQKKAVALGIGAFAVTALIARSRALQALLLLGGAGALAHRFRGREREWHDVPPPQA
jgi:hypothetical protein